MQLDIQPRNYQPSARVRNAIEDKAQKLLKYADVDRVRYTLTGEHVDFTCEIHVHTFGKDFHAKASTEDMLSSVDKASSTLEKQLRRYKNKRDDARRGGPDPSGLSSAAALEASIQRTDEVDEQES